MDKAYQPALHEPRARERWARAKAFAARPEAVLKDGKSPYTILIPPPNVTARLHLGHALNNTIQDVLARRKRMQGYETLWMPGADHAGIATQTVVEKKLLDTEGKKRTDYQRDDFIAKVQLWKDQYEAEIKDQLLAMGCSCDFDRWRFTMDPQCAAAVREAFFQLFKDGLIERGKRLVNWDPVTQTALADDEVDMKEVRGHFYYLKYPLTKPFTDDAGTRWTHITVATTRPETFLGDTAVAMNKRDPRAAALVGKTVTLPIVGREIPIIEDDYVVLPAEDPDAPGVDVKATYATGFLKVTPAHDPNDWEIGLRHTLPAINVMAPDASISDQHGWDDASVESRAFVGLSREDARKAVVAAFDELGLLEKMLDYSHSVGHSYRSHAAIEPYLSDQWYVKVTDDRLRGAAQRALETSQRTTDTFPAQPGVTGDNALRFHPERYAKTYEQWHDNLRDWCISRQLWWGHRIPVWTRYFDSPDQINVSGQQTEADFFGDTLNGILEGTSRTDWEQLSPEEQLEEYAFCVYTDANGSRLSEDEGSNSTWLDPDRFADGPVRMDICLASDPLIVPCTYRNLPKQRGSVRVSEFLEANGFTQDPDVLDTWFSSALWPLSTMGWPERTDLLKVFNPTNVLCTAREIITLWVSRMVMFNRYFLGENAQPGDVPFHHTFIHAMIQDGEGRKMSKSLGNGVDPLDIIHSHGADAMRFTLCQMTTQTQDVRMPVERDESTGRNTSPKFDLGKRFCNKLWNASRFTMMMLAESDADPSVQELTLADRWMLSRLASATNAIDAALDDYQFSAYADALYDLLWRDFCDWYLEAVKPTIKSNRTQQAILKNTLDAILRLLHPACPFVTETIYDHLRAAPHAGAVDGLRVDPAELLGLAPWPEVSESLIHPETEAAFDQLRALVEAIRDVRTTQGLSHKVALTLHTTPDLAARLRAGSGFVETIANLAAVTTDPAEGPALALAFEGAELKLTGHAATEGDADAQRERLTRQVADLDKSIAALEARLNNPGYTDKAPAKLVNQTRDQLRAQQDELAAARAALADLG